MFQKNLNFFYNIYKKLKLLKNIGQCIGFKKKKKKLNFQNYPPLKLKINK